MRAGKRIKKLVGDLWLKTFGWKVEGGVPDTRKAIVIAAPHTSNWDFPFTMAIAWSLGLDIAWLGKHTLFKPPFGTIMRSWGGIPVDRRGAHNLVTQVANKIKESDDLLVIVSPEGTRGSTGRWKTGFYHMAVEAEVPVILGFLDFKRKVGGLGTLFHPTGDLLADAEPIRVFYSKVTGKRPEMYTEVRFAEEDEANKKKIARPSPKESQQDASNDSPVMSLGT